MTLSQITLSIITLSVTTFSIKKFSITTLSIKNQKSKIHFGRVSVTVLGVIMVWRQPQTRGYIVQGSLTGGEATVQLTSLNKLV
jgi:hypothetical protein